jgi:hypothetical protein
MLSSQGHGLAWAPQPGTLSAGAPFRPYGGTALYHNGAVYLAGGWPVRAGVERTGREVGVGMAPVPPSHEQHVRTLTHRARTIGVGAIQHMTGVGGGGGGSSGTPGATSGAGAGAGSGTGTGVPTARDVVVDPDRFVGRFTVTVCRVLPKAPVADPWTEDAGYHGPSPGATSPPPPDAGPGPGAPPPALGSTGRTSVGDVTLPPLRGLSVPPLDLHRMRAASPEPTQRSVSEPPGPPAHSVIVCANDDRASHVAVSAPSANAILFFSGESVVFGKQGALLGDTIVLDTKTGKARTVSVSNQ